MPFFVVTLRCYPKIQTHTIKAQLFFCFFCKIYHSEYEHIQENVMDINGAGAEKTPVDLQCLYMAQYKHTVSEPRWVYSCLYHSVSNTTFKGGHILFGPMNLWLSTFWLLHRVFYSIIYLNTQSTVDSGKCGTEMLLVSWNSWQIHVHPKRSWLSWVWFFCPKTSHTMLSSQNNPSGRMNNSVLRFFWNYSSKYVQFWTFLSLHWLTF